MQSFPAQQKNAITIPSPSTLHRGRIAILLNSFLFFAIAVFAAGFQSNAQARSSALQLELPSVQGWKIEAIQRLSSISCSARQNEENGQKMTLLADTGKYRGGVWFLEITSRNHHFQPGTEEAVAHLTLDGKQVITGRALTIGDGKHISNVRFEFPAIDAHIKDISLAQAIEIQTHELNPIKINPISPIINTLEKCQQESLNLEFWKEAKQICN
ncbi:hypothetical protein AAFN46_17115 [Pseudomonas sp. CAU 1711]|uniref:hypothetical protein n=1 Tax=Pseudomonas sp. CAU 1711 TaxID=3140356 RepID=UPI0032605AA9